MLWRVQSSPAPGAHKRPLWAVMWTERKGLKRRVDIEEAQKHSKRTRKSKQTVLSADFTLLCLINTLLSESPRTLVWGKIATKASKAPVPHVPYI